MATQLFACFYFGDQFEYASIQDNWPTVTLGGHVLSYDQHQLTCDGQPYDGQIDDKLVILPQAEIKPFALNLPKRLIGVSNDKAASIQIDTLSSLYLTPDNGQLEMAIYPDGNDVYLNGQKVKERMVTAFNPGDYLVIHQVIIAYTEHQLQVVGLHEVIQFNQHDFICEAIKEDYPSDFPIFHRSPRIYLKEPEESISLKQPVAKEESGRNDLMKTIIPPLGMVVLGGVTSFLTGGNPLMMIGMGGASLLTAGFSVSSHLTNKREMKFKNQQRDAKYRTYVIEQKAHLESLKQNELMSLEYMYPSIDELATMVKDYHFRLYERMRTHHDFLELRLGTGPILASFNVSLDMNQEVEDELIDLAKEELVNPYYMVEDAPIIIPTIDQTIGLAGQYHDLRTAIQTMLFQMATLQSYRDVEFILLTSDEDYRENWQEWRWLPHLKLNELNLRGIVHNAKSRDMVLNSFYQLITKRKQALSEEGMDDITFAPHYVLAILDEKWLSGHGLNEFLAEDMSRFGVTVIWAKETRQMLPETVTTLIEYHSSEAGVLINKDHRYVNQLFTPNHLPHSFAIEEAIYRLANLDHVEVDKNAIPEKINFLELYHVQQVEELNLEERW